MQLYFALNSNVLFVFVLKSPIQQSAWLCESDIIGRSSTFINIAEMVLMWLRTLGVRLALHCIWLTDKGTILLRSCPDLLLTPSIKKHTRENRWNVFRKYMWTYKECIRNINGYLWYRIIRNTDPMGRPPKAAPVFLIILYHKYVWVFLIHSLYIPYIFPSYVPYNFPCVFLNLWNQQKRNLAWVLREVVSP